MKDDRQVVSLLRAGSGSLCQAVSLQTPLRARAEGVRGRGSGLS